MKKFILIAVIAVMFTACVPTTEKVVDSTDSVQIELMDSTDSVQIEFMDGTDSVIVDTLN